MTWVDVAQEDLLVWNAKETAGHVSEYALKNTKWRSMQILHAPLEMSSRLSSDRDLQRILRVVLLILSLFIFHLIGR